MVKSASKFIKSASKFICMQPDLLTTDEAAIYLRLSPRKLYELLAKGAVPCTKVTGRWLFPRAALDRWVMAVVISFARREQGIVTAPGNPLKLSDIASVAKSRARLAQRPPGAGAQLLLLALLARANIAANDLALMAPVCATGMDIAQAVRSNRADCGIVTRSVALAAGLNFLPITWEHFDLVLRQRDYFLPGPQALFEFMRTAALRERAMEFGGYDVDAIGAVRLVN